MLTSNVNVFCAGGGGAAVRLLDVLDFHVGLAATAAAIWRRNAADLDAEAAFIFPKTEYSTS